jgi:hypothetical protein
VEIADLDFVIMGIARNVTPAGIVTEGIGAINISGIKTNAKVKSGIILLTRMVLIGIGNETPGL